MEPPKLNVRLVTEDIDDDERASHAADFQAVSGGPGESRDEPRPNEREPMALPSNVAALPSADRRESLRVLEALLFAASEPLDEQHLASHLRQGFDVPQMSREKFGVYVRDETTKWARVIREAGIKGE